MRALVLEPNRLFRDILIKLFEGDGIEAVFSDTAKDGIESYQNEVFDLVCTSYHLNDMSGIEFCRQVQLLKRNLHIPVILLTANDDRQTIEDGMKSGITEIFKKDKLSEFQKYLKAFRFVHNRHQKLHGHILMVEDNISVAKVLQASIKNLGLNVEHYTTAEEAITAFRENEYDLVLTDVVLAGNMTGIGLVREIRKESGDKGRIPILALSAMDDATRKIELLNSGASDFLLKPVLEEELYARVRNLVMNKQLFDKVEIQRNQLRKMAMTDQLTGLHNRHFLMEVAHKYVSDAYRHKQHLSLIVIDIDHFKKINDKYGHAKGDEVLKACGQLMRESCRDGDVAARFGGEEFVMLLGHCDAGAAENKAEHIRESIEALKPAGIHLTASFGVTSLGLDVNMTFDDLFAYADEAVYAAKNAGRNCVESRHHLPETLRDAI